MSTDTTRSYYSQPAVRAGGSNNLNTWAFAFVFVVVNLHTMRRSYTIPYLGLYAVASGFALAAFAQVRAWRRLTDTGLAISLWITVALMGAIATTATTSFTGAITGLSRFLFAVPVFFAFAAFTDSLQQFRRNLGVMAAFFTIGALTIPLQEFTGAIGLFADASGRAGFERYSSLLGSLPVVGGMIAVYLLILFASSLRWKPIWMVGMGGSALISLSKAAIGNVAIALLSLLWVNRKKGTRLALATAFVGLLFIGFLALSDDFLYRILGVLLSYGIVIEGVEIRNFDQTAGEGVVSRLLTLPLENFSALATFGSPFVYILGGGFGMAGRSLVAEADVQAIQAHNGYAEMLSVFGLFGAVMLVTIILSALFRIIRIYRRTKDETANYMMFIAGIWVVGLLFAGGRLYQPIGVSAWWAILYFSLSTAVLYPGLKETSVGVSSSHLSNPRRSR